MRQPAVFLDRDGVINYDRADYVKRWAEFAFLPGALTALRQLAGLGWPVIVVSNQAAIGRGLASRETVEAINLRMRQEVWSAGGRIDDVLYCPHRPDDKCDCRKPQPGLLRRAAGRLGLELSASFMVGDAESDMLAALKAGCHPVLVKTGRGREQYALLQSHGVDGFAVADDLAAAVDWIAQQALVSAKDG